MAIIGVKHLMYAPITNYTVGSMPTYGTGAVLARLTKIDYNPTKSDVDFYADDIKAEEDHTVTGGTITVGVDDLTQDVQKGIFGNVQETQATIKVLCKAANDEAPYVGLGYVIPHKRRGTRVYEAVMLLRVMFSEPNESAETKGETISFQGKEIEGSFSPVEGYENDRYRISAEFSTESAADEWLKTKLNVTDPLRGASSPATTTTTTSGSGNK